MSATPYAPHRPTQARVGVWGGAGVRIGGLRKGRAQEWTVIAGAGLALEECGGAWGQMHRTGQAGKRGGCGGRVGRAGGVGGAWGHFGSTRPTRTQTHPSHSCTHAPANPLPLPHGLPKASAACSFPILVALPAAHSVPGQLPVFPGEAHGYEDVGLVLL